jgi:FkbM family methyltransferase
MKISKAVQRVFRACGFNLTRLPGNRFDVMPDVLARLRREGFEPAAIIDVGANRGQWAGVVSRVFPDAPLHMIEPQAVCRPALEAFAAIRGRAHIHQAVVTRAGVEEVQVVNMGGGSTGAHVVLDPTRTDGRFVPATTLDALLGTSLDDAGRVLLKLDVEGHELEVLAGGAAVLRRVEVIVTEVTFYDVEGAGEPAFLDYATALAARGFVLYEFAALGSRARDGRLRMGDALFVRRGSPLLEDDSWG